jgi:nicotinamidase-related amidase
MRTIDRDRSSLLIIDFQSRLLPAIEDGETAVANARRLVQAAALFKVPVLFTEQNPRGLGSTVPELAPGNPDAVALKMTFDACRMPGFLDRLACRPDVVAAGCESHVCVQQTVLGLLDAGKRVYLVRDAVGSRRSESKDTAVRLAWPRRLSHRYDDDVPPSRPPRRPDRSPRCLRRLRRPFGEQLRWPPHQDYICQEYRNQHGELVATFNTRSRWARWPTAIRANSACRSSW